nr:MAG TPA: hypothetical protein [Caudoviricetes sp.]
MPRLYARGTSIQNHVPRRHTARTHPFLFTHKNTTFFRNRNHPLAATLLDSSPNPLTRINLSYHF